MTTIKNDKMDPVKIRKVLYKEILAFFFDSAIINNRLKKERRIL